MQAKSTSVLAFITVLILNPLHTHHTHTQSAANITTAATYYLSSTGNDTNSGHALEQPWRTLGRLQTEISAGNLHAGDQVLFARGSVFTGSLKLDAQTQGSATAPIVFSSYGSGAAPVISGLAPLSNWQSLGSNRWRAACTGCSAVPAFLLLNGEPQRIARWPNLDEGDEGYRYYAAFSGRTSITDPALPSDKNWAGGEVVLRSIAWVLDRLPIASQVSGTLTFGSPATYDIQAGYGYFIQNHINALDRDGEWVYDAISKTVTLQLSRDPNAQTIDVPAQTTLLEIRNSNYVIFRDLDLRGAAQDAVNADGCANIIFDQVTLRYNGDEAVNTGACSSVTLSNARVQDSMNVGLRMQPCANCRVSAVTLERVGLLAGMGGNGDGQYFGTDVGGANFVIENSMVRDIGYVAISLYGAGTVRNNLVSGFNRVKTDGAGIYTYRQSNVAILNNIVRDASGSKAGTPWSGTATNGIYIDDNSERVTVQGNTVANVSGAGIYLHNTRDVTVTQNLIYNTGEVGLLMTDDNLGTYGLERSLVRQNQFVLRDVPMLSVQSSITANLFSTLGVIDSNAFCDPFGEPTFRVDLPGVGERIKTLAQWRADHGRDLASTRCADRYPSRTVTGTPGPNRVSNGNFDSDLTGWFGWPDDTLDARWETGRLDGGSVRIGYKGPSTTLHYDTSIGAVQAKQTYRLRVDAKSITGTPAFSAYLRQSGAPYAKVSQTVPLFVDGNRRTFELFFDTTASEADTLLIFEMASLGSGVGLDNVQLQTVIAPLQVLSNVVRFEANPTTQSQVITLDNYTYRGGDGTAYPARSTLTLTPFGAIVLLRGEISNATPTPPTKPTVYLSTVMK